MYSGGFGYQELISYEKIKGDDNVSELIQINDGQAVTSITQKRVTDTAYYIWRIQFWTGTSVKTTS